MIINSDLPLLNKHAYQPTYMRDQFQQPDVRVYTEGFPPTGLTGIINSWGCAAREALTHELAFLARSGGGDDTHTHTIYTR